MVPQSMPESPIVPPTFEPIDELIDGATTVSIPDRVVQFEYCISLVLVTIIGKSEPIHLTPRQFTFWRSIPYQLITLLTGWWGLPWGPLLTIRTFFRNLFSGNRFGLVMGVMLAALSTAQAGIYSPNIAPLFEPGASGNIVPLSFDGFRRELADQMLLGISGPTESPARKALITRTDALLARPESELSQDELAELTANLLRLRKLDPALPLLRQLSRDRRMNFVLLAHLATLHQLREEYGDAIAAQEVARSEFPDEMANFTPAQLAWYKRLEREYVLRLLRLRRNEPSRIGPAASVDDLFAGVKFVDESGGYTPGQLAAVERAKLPSDALAIVQQLLLWTPEDSRLFWLLGELYQADNQLIAAAKIFDECVDTRRFQNETLIAHRHRIHEVILAQTPEPESFLPSTQRTAIVGGLAGLIVLGLVIVQIRETRRRWRAKGRS